LSNSPPPSPSTSKELDRVIVSLATPAVVENVLLTAVSFTDTLMVGWLRDSAALAAVAMGVFINSVITSLFSALTISSTSLIARSWGARKFENARLYLGQALFLALISGLAVGLSGFFLSPWILSLMGLSGEALLLGNYYFRLIILVNFFTFPALVLFGALRGSGDTRTPMIITGFGNLLHIVLAFFLIFGWGVCPAYGLKGAAWATVIATVLSSLSVIVLAFKGKGEFYFSLSRFRVYRPYFSEMLSLTAPAFWEALVFRGAQVVFMRFVSALGEIALAAHQVALSIESLSYMPGWGFAVASTTLAGQFLGAGEPGLTERSVWRTTRFGLFVLSAFGLLFLLAGDRIAMLFGGTPEVIAQAGIAIRLGGLEQPGLAVLMILSGALRGAGDTKSPLKATIAGVVVGRLLLVYILAFPVGLGLAGVWLATAFDWSIRAGFVYYYFRKGTWRKFFKTGTSSPAAGGKAE